MWRLSAPGKNICSAGKGGNDLRSLPGSLKITRPCVTLGPAPSAPEPGPGSRGVETSQLTWRDTSGSRVGFISRVRSWSRLQKAHRLHGDSCFWATLDTLMSRRSERSPPPPARYCKKRERSEVICLIPNPSQNKSLAAIFPGRFSRATEKRRDGELGDKMSDEVG